VARWPILSVARGPDVLRALAIHLAAAAEICDHRCELSGLDSLREVHLIPGGKGALSVFAARVSSKCKGRSATASFGREGNPEAHSQALTSCRRLLSSIADAVFPPRNELAKWA
jgi:hypothetical protein